MVMCFSANPNWCM